MKKLLILTSIALLNPFSASAQNCISTDAACFRQPGSLAPEAKIDAAGIPTFSGLVSCDTIDTDANGVASCGTDDGGGVSLSGNNVWTSTNTYGPNADVTVSDYSSVIKGGISEVATTEFSASVDFTFTNISSSYTHVIEVWAKQNTVPGVLRLEFEGDASGIYDGIIERKRADGTTEAQSSTNAGACQITGATSTDDNGPIYAKITLKKHFDNATDSITIFWDAWHESSDNVITYFDGFCNWPDTGSSSGVVSVRIFTSAGTITGNARVFAQVPAVSF